MNVEAVKERLQAIRSEPDTQDRAVMLQYMMQLPEPARRLLVARYYNRCSWSEIMDAQGYTGRQCKRRYSKALKELARIIP